MIPHNRPTYGPDEEQAVQGAIQLMAQGKAGSGQIVRRFERALAEYFGTEAAVCVGSGLGALRIVSEMCLGHEVRMPAYSCVALANAVLASGGRSIPSDAGPYDIAVATFGHCDFGPCKVADITHGGRPLIGIAILSFGPTKLLAAGAGGVILCSQEDADDFQWIRDYKDRPPHLTRLNDTMSDLHAAVGLVQLGKLDHMLRWRRRLGALYNAALGENVQSESFYRYVIQVDDPGRFIEAMAQQGVEVKRPIELWNDCPGAVEQYHHNVSLPCYPRLSERDQEQVIRAVKKCR